VPRREQRLRRRVATDAFVDVDTVRYSVLDGLIAGRRATSSIPPLVPPGYFSRITGPGVYRLLAMPSGSYTLRVSRPGYLVEERQVIALFGADVHIPLQRQ
jgi:hypothetical protein